MRSCGASFTRGSGVAYKPLYTLLTFGNAELKGEHFCGICAGSCHLYSSGGSRVKGGRRGSGCAESGGFARGALFSPCSRVALRAGVSLGARIAFRASGALFTFCALQGAVVYPLGIYAVPNIYIIRFARAHAVSVTSGGVRYSGL